LIEASSGQAESYYGAEIQRLQRLAKINKHVDKGEIASLEERRAGVLEAIATKMQLHVSAMRLIVITKPEI